MEQNLKTLLDCEFFESYDGETPAPGTVCRAVFPFIPQKKFSIIEPLSTDPCSPDSRKYRLFSKGFAELRADLANSRMPPHYELGLRSNEVAVVIKAKSRPVIVLTPLLSDDETTGFPSHFKNCVLCVPLYTLVYENNEMNPSYDPMTIQSITALKYRAIFPVLPQPYLESRISGLRLDRIHPIRAEFLSKPECKATSKCFAFICAWIRFYATGRLAGKPKPPEKETPAELLGAARELLLETLRKQSNE